MAKTLSSICFTALLLVVLLISAEIPKSEAQRGCNTFLGEGPEGTTSNPCTVGACFTSCQKKFRATCRGECERHDNEDHCHCFGP